MQPGPVQDPDLRRIQLEALGQQFTQFALRALAALERLLDLHHTTPLAGEARFVGAGDASGKNINQGGTSQITIN